MCGGGGGIKAIRLLKCFYFFSAFSRIWAWSAPSPSSLHPEFHQGPPTLQPHPCQQLLEPSPHCQTVGPVASPSGESLFHLGWAAYCVTLCHLGAYDTCHLSASDLPRITATTFYGAITGSHAVLSVAFFADEHFLKLRTSETAFLFLPGR